MSRLCQRNAHASLKKKVATHRYEALKHGGKQSVDATGCDDSARKTFHLSRPGPFFTPLTLLIPRAVPDEKWWELKAAAMQTGRALRRSFPNVHGTHRARESEQLIKLRETWQRRRGDLQRLPGDEH